jgi:hypothetical protein
MQKKPSTLKKNILYFLALFNYITFPIIVILFVVFILIDIPLKYLFGFIVVYAISYTTSLLFETKETSSPEKLPQWYIYISLLGVNTIILLFLTLLIGRYELDEYRLIIYSLALGIMNGLFFEFTYHFISRFMKTSSGAWVWRTLLLFIGAGIGILGVNVMRVSPPPTVATTPQKTSSEVTGVLSTVDPNAPVEEIVTPQEETTASQSEILLSWSTSDEVWPWDTITRGIWIGDNGTDVRRIQEFLAKTPYYTGGVTGTYDTLTATALNQYIKDKTWDEFNRLEIWNIKLATLKWISTPKAPSQENEVTGTLTTEKDTSGIQIDSIESLDGKATATVKDGKITVQVINPPSSVTNTGTTVTDGWKIHSSIARKSGGGGLQWVVISAAVALPMAGIHTSYQSIILTADWASGIFFTTDGSEPNCDGKWLTDAVIDSSTLILKTISCFGGNRIRWPVASYTYMLGR